MGRVISVVSGKGGVGKTTIACGVALSLAKSGQSVCLVDLDVGLNNIDVLLNLENKVVYDIGDYLAGRCRLKQALVNDSRLENLYLLPSVRYGDVDKYVTTIQETIKKLAGVFDFVIIDSPAGHGENFENAVLSSNQSVVVVTPHLAAIRDADKTISKVEGFGLPAWVVVNRIRGDMVVRKEMLSHNQIEMLLKTKVIGVVPESDEINILSSIHFEKTAKHNTNNVFFMLKTAILQEKSVIFNYESKYRGLFGVIRRRLKRGV